MTDLPRAAEVRGRTIRFAWTEGPTAGRTHEHVFHPDGTVEWHDAGAASGPAGERPDYAAVKVADGIVAVSYLAPSGYTLTVVLNFGSCEVVGFASSAKDWHPVRGRLEVMG